MKTLLPLLFPALLSFAAADLSAADGRDPAWVDARVAEIAIKPEERKVDQIGWAKDIREAKRLARERNRAVFLFTHDGRLNIGRC